MLNFVEKQQLSVEKEMNDALTILERVADQLSKQLESTSEPDRQLLKYRVWTKGLASSLKELFASYEAAYYYRQKINTKVFGDMTEDEQKWYAHYVYFDKNAFIRVFSLLDKLGTFINAGLKLETERIKVHFSFFTVLRNLREKKLYPVLTLPLNEVKENSKDATFRLRKRRNTEIHYMNSEMEDDLIQETRLFGQDIQLENLDQQLDDLYIGLLFNINAIKLTFQYAEEQILK